jgi:hypothetical protein
VRYNAEIEGNDLTNNRIGSTLSPTENANILLDALANE